MRSHSFFEAQYLKVGRTLRADDFAAFVRTRVRPKEARFRSHVTFDFIEFSFGPPVGRWASGGPWAARGNSPRRRSHQNLGCRETGSREEKSGEQECSRTSPVSQRRNHNDP